MNLPARSALAGLMLVTHLEVPAQGVPEPQGGGWQAPLPSGIVTAYGDLLRDAPRAPITRLVMDTETGALKRKVETFFERQPDGTLLTVQLLPGQVKILSRALTVRGLHEVRARTEIDTSINSIPVLVGKGIYSPSWKLGSATSAVNVLGQELTGDLAAMVNPLPGAVMNFGVKADVFIAQTAMFGKVNYTAAQREITYACRVGQRAPASTLLAKLRGDYLPVECEVVANGKSSTKKYVYLLDSQQYVLVSNVDALVANFNQSAAFIDVDYAEAP